MKAMVIRGGSGKWQMRTPDGDAIAGGHVPAGLVPGSVDWELVVVRQAKRQVDQPYEEIPSLGGGRGYDVEVPQRVYDALVVRLEAHKAAEKKAYDEANEIIEGHTLQQDKMTCGVSYDEYNEMFRRMGKSGARIELRRRAQDIIDEYMRWRGL